MKILQVVAAYKPAYIYGGPTMSVSKLCESLKANGITLEVLTTTANGQSELPVIPNQSTIVEGVKVTYFKRITKDHTHFSPTLLKMLRKEILHDAQNDKILIVHIHAWWNLVSIFTCSIAKWYNIPVILSPRGMLTTYTSANRNSGMKGIIHRLIGKRLLQYCHIHATSQKEKEDVLAYIQPKSITVIPNLVDLPIIRERKDIIQQRATSNDFIFKLLFLSRVEEKKGLELLFEALVECTFDWHLTIAGTGEDNYVRSLKQKAESLKLIPHITWLGHVDNEHKFKVMADHDLLVLTSYNENFANVVIESLSVGTPVLLSDQVGLADYIAKKELGWITNLDVANITTNIREAYHAIDKRTQIREIVPEIISVDFGEDQLTQKYVHLYKNVIHE